MKRITTVLFSVALSLAVVLFLTGGGNRMNAFVICPEQYVVLASRERGMLYNMIRLVCSPLKVHERKEKV